MNPEFSVGELVSVINLVWTVCKEFENAAGELDNLREELKSLHDVLGKFQSEILRDEFRSCLASDDRDDRAGHRTAYSDEREKLNILQREASADYMEEIRSNLFSLEKELGLLGSNSKSKSDAQKLHPGTIQNCIAKPFTRLYDLNCHKKTTHKDEERADECSWPILLQRIQSDLDQCSKILSKGQRRRVCSTKMPKIEASPFNCRDADDKNLRTYLLWRRITWLPINNSSSRTSMYPRERCGHLHRKSCSFGKWCLRFIAFTSIMAAVSMSASFFQYVHASKIETPSNIVKWIISVSMPVLPPQVIKFSYEVRQSSSTFYILSAALYSVVTAYWFLVYLRISSMNYWYIFGVSTTIIWILLGVTPAELFLAFLPLTLSIGICAQALCGELIVSPTDCKKCTRVQDRPRKLTVYPMQLVQHQELRKQDCDPFIQDLETASKADSGF